MTTLHPATITPKSTTCVCTHDAAMHLPDIRILGLRQECDGSVTVDDADNGCPCGQFVSEDDVCLSCDGLGRITDHRDWFDGRRCPTCSGTGVNAS